MKTADQLRTELKEVLANGNVPNDGSLAAQTQEKIQWAWENWEEEYLKNFYEGDKPEIYTESFFIDWIDNEPFDEELDRLNDPELE